MNKKSVLGRGLGALIEDPETETSAAKVTFGASELPTELIDTNPFQPRTQFSPEALEDLTTSIREVGMVQPVTVRDMGNGRYQLITGERRLKAAKAAGLTKIPVFIRTANDQAMLEMALIENIQREDLNSVDIAISFQRLVEECELTQENLSQRVGKKRATVSNYMRLLKLPAEIQLGIRQDKISMGHARALITIEDPNEQIELFYKIIEKGLSVRRAEELARKINKLHSEQEPDKTAPDEKYQPYEELKKQLSEFFQAGVEFRRNNKGSGKIIIPFRSDDELERIIGIFDRLK